MLNSYAPILQESTKRSIVRDFAKFLVIPSNKKIMSPANNYRPGS